MTEMHRAYSVLQIRAARDSDEFFEFDGIATTPTPDRYGDVVEPLGARFAAEIPLLWQHRAELPVGRVKFGKPTNTGIPFSGRIPLVREDGTLKQRIDEAVQSVKYGLVNAVSIGFRAFNNAVESIKEGGLRFREFEVLELSLVTIPANSEAVITAVKALDRQHIAAVGRAVRLVTPGVPGQQQTARKGAIQLIPRKST